MRSDDIYLQRWFSLLENQSIEHELKQSLYEDLRLCYAEPQRAYHTFKHIKACLAHLDNVSNQLEDAFEVELALWLHDVRSKTNELDSATYASEQLQKLNLSTQCIERVHQLILITFPSYLRKLMACSINFLESGKVKIV